MFAPSDESAADNRNLVADQTSQSMTKEQITKMKEQGATGKEIISTIIDNSAYSNIVFCSLICFFVNARNMLIPCLPQGWYFSIMSAAFIMSYEN